MKPGIITCLTARPEIVNRKTILASLGVEPATSTVFPGLSGLAPVVRTCMVS